MITSIVNDTSEIVNSTVRWVWTLPEKVKEFVLNSFTEEQRRRFWEIKEDALREGEELKAQSKENLAQVRRNKPNYDAISSIYASENLKDDINRPKGDAVRTNNDVIEPFKAENRREKRKLERVVTDREQNRKEKNRDRELSKAQKRNDREAKYFDKLAKRYTLGETPEKIPFDVWEMGQRIIFDQSGKAAELYLNGQGNKNAVDAIHSAIGDTESIDDLRDRRIVALGLLFAKLGKWAPSTDGYNKIVRGIPETALLKYLRVPGRPDWDIPSLSALNGIHRTDATVGSYKLGYLRSLEWSGLLWREQPHKRDAPSIETMGEYALNVYHVIGPRAELPKDDPIVITVGDWKWIDADVEQTAADGLTAATGELETPQSIDST